MHPRKDSRARGCDHILSERKRRNFAGRCVIARRSAAMTRSASAFWVAKTRRPKMAAFAFYRIDSLWPHPTAKPRFGGRRSSRPAVQSHRRHPLWGSGHRGNGGRCCARFLLSAVAGIGRNRRPGLLDRTTVLPDSGRQNGERNRENGGKCQESKLFIHRQESRTVLRKECWRRRSTVSILQPAFAQFKAKLDAAGRRAAVVVCTGERTRIGALATERRGCFRLPGWFFRGAIPPARTEPNGAGTAPFKRQTGEIPRGRKKRLTRHPRIDILLRVSGAEHRDVPGD